ncbi:MAG: hypothetical protein QOD14_1996 [Solirubrobacterales bacterium]|jgi:hypothetical protein|nr:hypothetical protein [Solirubrobacterales bacterium]
MPAEDLAWLGAIAAGIGLVAAFAWLAPALATLYPSPDQAIFGTWHGLIHPEHREDVRGMLALATPFLVGITVVALGSRRLARRSFDPLIVTAQIAGLGLLAWAVTEQRNVLRPIPADYLKPLLFGVPNLVAGVLIGGAITALILFWSGVVPNSLARAGALARRRGLAPAAAGIATVVFLLPAVVTDATVGHSGLFAPSQIAIYADDYFAVVDGRTPLVDYIGQYSSLLPLAVGPVLGLFHSSITSFSIAMCTLSGLALLAIFGVFKEVTRRPWAALALYVPFLALGLFPWHDQGAFREFNGNYYALLPERLFGPFLLAWLCALSTRRRVPIWALFGWAGFVVVNNAEFGIGALVALIVAVAVSWDRTVPIRERLSRIAVEGAAGLLGAIAIVCAVILVRTGSFPDPTLLTYFNRLFLRDSFGLFPMQALGLHWALYATYAAALVVAAVRYVREEPDRTLTAMLGFSGAFGLVTGMYFVGRSVEIQLMILFPVWAFCLALLAWTGAGTLRSARGDKRRLRRLLLPACAALIGFGVMVSAIDRVSPPWSQVDRLTSGGRAVDDTPNAQRFVEAHTDPGDSIFLIGTPLDHRVADRAGVTNVSPVSGYMSLVTSAEADRALDQLQAAGGDLVFEAVTAPSAVNPSPFKIRQLAAILSRRGYRLDAVDPSSGLRLWRRASGTPAA